MPFCLLYAEGAGRYRKVAWEVAGDRRQRRHHARAGATRGGRAVHRTRGGAVHAMGHLPARRLRRTRWPRTPPPVDRAQKTPRTGEGAGRGLARCGRGYSAAASVSRRPQREPRPERPPPQEPRRPSWRPRQRPSSRTQRHAWPSRQPWPRARRPSWQRPPRRPSDARPSWRPRARGRPEAAPPNLSAKRWTRPPVSTNFCWPV